MKSIELKACDLARKSGFGDGDLVSWFIESLEDRDLAHQGIEERVAALDLSESDEDGYPGHTGDHRILVAAVRKHLAPLLPGVGIIDFSTSHNPVRAEVQDQAACAASDVSVTIDVDALLAIIAEIEAEQAAAPQTVIAMRPGTDAHPSAFGVSEPTGAGEEPIDLDARRKQREAEKMEAARRKLLWELEEFGC